MAFEPSENPITNPTRESYTELRPFRFWCQKVLPLVYDNSLSYYELLCKVVDYLNKTMEDVDHMNTDINTLYSSFQEFQEGTLRIYNELVAYVNTYFDELDVQEEIDNKLDEMVTSGELVTILRPSIAEEVSSWLEEHVSPTTPLIDDTFTIQGAGADSKAVGDAFDRVDDELKILDDCVDTIELNATWLDGWIDASGNIQPQSSDINSEVYTEEYFETYPGDKIKFVLYAPNRPNFAHWVRMGLYSYDGTYHWIRRDNILDITGEYAVYTWENTFSGGPYYFRLTMKSGYNGENNNNVIFIKNEKARLDATLDKERLSNTRISDTQNLIKLTAVNKYIATNTSVVDLTPVNYTGAGYAIIDCSEGDLFTIRGSGYSTGRLWAFCDASNNLLTYSSVSSYAKSKIIEAPANASKLIVNVNINIPYYIIRGDSSNVIDTGYVLTNNNVNNHYINTGLNVGEQVDITPIAYMGYTFRVIECDYGDKFIVAGISGNAGRLWAFLNNDNRVISVSKPNEVSLGYVISAPLSSKKLIVNAENDSLFVEKSSGLQITNALKCAVTEVPRINDFPSDIVSKPTVEFSQYVQEQENVSGAKGSIFKNNNDYCLTYGENLDGTGVDIPLFSESGCLAMKYKFFHYENGVATNVRYGNIASKGSTYLDYLGNTKTMSGGTGFSSGCTSPSKHIQYFTTVEELNSNDPRYSFSGIANYGMIPCCCTVTVDSNGVTFGQITELKLVYQGVTGKFDMHRIDPDYINDYSYLTTTPPFVSGNIYIWFQIVKNGFVRLHSTDGITWTYAETYKTPYQPLREVIGLAHNNYFYYAVRTVSSKKGLSDQMYFGKISASTKQVAYEYRLPFIETRPFICASGSDILLLYTPANKQIVECIRVVDYQNREAFFWRWFTIYKNCTWYIWSNIPSLSQKEFTKMYLVGGNTEEGSLGGMTFMVLNVPTNKPRTPSDIPAEVI